MTTAEIEVLAEQCRNAFYARGDLGHQRPWASMPEHSKEKYRDIARVCERYLAARSAPTGAAPVSSRAVVPRIARVAAQRKKVLAGPLPVDDF